MRTWSKTVANKFAISNRYYVCMLSEANLKLVCEYELRSLPNKKASGAKDHGKNYIKVRPPGRHLLHNCVLMRHLFDSGTYFKDKQKYHTLKGQSTQGD